MFLGLAVGKWSRRACSAERASERAGENGGALATTDALNLDGAHEPTGATVVAEVSPLPVMESN